MKSTLRLGVDARDVAADSRGIGRYTRAVLRRLALEPDIELRLLIRGPFPALRRKPLQAALGNATFTLATKTQGCNLVWHPANGTFFAGRAPSVATIHDAVPFRFPHDDRTQRSAQQEPFLRSVRAATRYIAVSNFGRNELHEVFGIPGDRIDVIYHGVDSAFAPDAPRDALPPPLRARPYLLFAGETREAVEPRKNFGLLYRAYRQAFTAGDPLLAVVGPTDPHLEGVHYAGLASGDSHGEGDGFLRALYCGALALCVPSYYETFGMPMVEAMACGTPVIASHASCLPEIAGDAARYAQPHDIAAWVTALREVRESPELRATLRGKGLAHAKRFDWAKSAAAHASVFRAAVRASNAPLN